MRADFKFDSKIKRKKFQKKSVKDLSKNILKNFLKLDQESKSNNLKLIEDFSTKFNCEKYFILKGRNG